jgi:hypothetical protein
VQKVGTLTKKKKKREEKRMLTNPSHAQALYLPLTFFVPPPAFYSCPGAFAPAIGQPGIGAALTGTPLLGSESAGAL